MDNTERLELSAEMDKAAEGHELAVTETVSLRAFYKALAGIHVRRVEADRMEKLAEEYRQKGVNSPPGGAVIAAESAEAYTADAAYLRAEADRMEQQFGFTAEEVAWARAQVREMRAEQALETAFRKLGHWEWLPATEEEGGGPTGPHPLFTGDATEQVPTFAGGDTLGGRAVWMPAGCDFRQRVIGGERPDECPTYWADEGKCVCDLPVDQLHPRIRTSLDDRYMEGRQDAMNGRYNTDVEYSEDYRRGHKDALVEQMAAVSRENAPPKSREYVEGWQDAMNGRYNIGNEDYEDYRRGHRYGSAERARMTAVSRENRITEVNDLAAQVLAKQSAGAKRAWAVSGGTPRLVRRTPDGEPDVADGDIIREDGQWIGRVKGYRIGVWEKPSDAKAAVEAVVASENFQRAVVYEASAEKYQREANRYDDGITRDHLASVASYDREQAEYYRGVARDESLAKQAATVTRENRITEVNDLAAQVLAKQLADGSYAQAIEELEFGGASYWRDAYDNSRAANKDLKAELDYAQTQIKELEAARGHECPDGLPDCPQCALNRRVEAANAATGFGERVPRGLLPTAVVWEDEDTGGWRVAFSDGECAGMSLGSFLGAEQARAAAGRLGYKEDRQFVYPMAAGPFRRLCGYTGEIRGGSEGSDLMETRELRSSYLVTARSDDDAIAAALAECADYLDELLDDHGLAFDEPPVFAVIDAEEPDGETRRIYARPAGVFRPATAYYTCPENEHHRAELFTDDPHPGDLCWTADGWAHENGGKPPPIVIRSGERLDARIRDFRGDNTRGAGLSL